MQNWTVQLLSNGQKLFTNEIGDKIYGYYNLLHREDGPAKEFTNGHKEWWFFGVLHRADGPAKICGEIIEYYFDGNKITAKNDEEFKSILETIDQNISWPFPRITRL